MQKVVDILYYGQDAQNLMVRGLNKLADAVKVTMGPGGRYVVMKMPGEEFPRVTKDGVSVAKYVKLTHPVEDMGAQLMKQSSAKTVAAVGDGTTTATVLTQAMVNSALLEGEIMRNPEMFRRGLEDGGELLKTELKKHSKTKLGLKELLDIATTSANGDRDVAQHVARLVHEVGTEGIISVEKSDKLETTSNLELGYKLDKGVPSTRFFNDGDNNNLHLTGGGLVLILESKLESFTSILDIVTYAKNQNKFLLLIAQGYSDAVLNNCLENSRRGTFIIPILAPEFGNQQLVQLEDLAIYVDASITTERAIKTSEDLSSIRLGFVDNLTSKLEYTIISSSVNLEKVSQRKLSLEKLAEEAKNTYDRDKLQSRISKLGAGYASIFVGGMTPAEISERYDRYEDAVGACQSALLSGVLPGGGVALYHIGKTLLATEQASSTDVTDYERGKRAIFTAALEPMTVILNNAGFSVEDNISQDSASTGHGLNVLTGEYVDLYEDGILDPLEVTISAISSSISVASLILTTGCVMDNTQINLYE